MYATDHMDAADYESSCEAPIPFTFLYTHGSGIFQAVSFQPLDEAAGNEAVCHEAVAPTRVVGIKASSFHPSLLQAESLPPSLFQMWLPNLRCGFGASNTHSPCR